MVIKEKRVFSDSVLIKMLMRHDKDMVERSASTSDVNVKGETRVTTRREIDLKAEVRKLDKEGLAALEIVVKQLEDANDAE